MFKSTIEYHPLISKRFRGYHPIVVDVECGGLNADTDALLEIAAVSLNCNENGIWAPAETAQHHIIPFEGSILNPESLAINKIDPFHPFRFAVTEKQALQEIFTFLEEIIKKSKCNRCVLVGHNAWFDLAFLNAAIKRCNIKRSPFHAFTSLDTATLCAAAFGQTVLAEGLKAAKIPFDNTEHHSAIYDAEKTALLFCDIINKWPKNL